MNETWDEAIFRDGHTAAVRRAVFSPDGKLLVSVSEDHQVIVWDFTRRMRLKTLTDHTGAVTAVAFSPDGKWFVTGGEDETAILWNAARLEKETVWHDYPAAVITASFSSDGSLLAYAAGAVLTIRETKSWTKVRELPSQLGGHGVYIFFDNDQKVADNRGDVWNVATGEKLVDVPDNWLGNWAALSPDGKRWVSVDPDGVFKGWDLPGGTNFHQQHAHHDHGRALAYSPDGKFIASGAERVLLWDVNRRKLLTTIGTHTSPIYALAFSPDGQRLFTGEHDRSVRQYRKRRTLWGFSLN